MNVFRCNISEWVGDSIRFWRYLYLDKSCIYLACEFVHNVLQKQNVVQTIHLTMLNARNPRFYNPKSKNTLALLLLLLLLLHHQKVLSLTSEAKSICFVVDISSEPTIFS